jgi:hypothetical protein
MTGLGFQRSMLGVASRQAVLYVAHWILHYGFPTTLETGTRFGGRLGKYSPLCPFSKAFFARSEASRNPTARSRHLDPAGRRFCIGP